MAWETKCQLVTSTTSATVHEEEFMLDLAYGGPMFEEARRELFGRVKPHEI